jgi:hypothetical protein
MIRQVKVLVLEDDLEAVEYIYKSLREAQIGSGAEFGVTVIPDYLQVKQLINKNPKVKFEILLLDRDCFLGGSFHTVNLDNFDLDKVISISSVPEWNKEVKKRGIKRVVYKDFDDLVYFARNLRKEIWDILQI